MQDTKTLPSYQENLTGLLEQLAEMLPQDKLAVFHQDAERLGAAQTAPLKLGNGDQAPLFSLPNAGGKTVKLDELLQQGPVVLTFYRGTWCPYCNLQLRTYQQILPEIKQAGAKLVAVSPMTPDHSLQMQQSNELQFEVLSDVQNKVARQYTTVFENPATSIKAMADLGYDFYSFYDDASGELPVPATFVIARDGNIKYAGTAGGDYRQRVEPQQILAALTQ